MRSRTVLNALIEAGLAMAGAVSLVADGSKPKELSNETSAEPVPSAAFRRRHCFAPTDVFG
jgi:hypothetical protein